MNVEVLHELHATEKRPQRLRLRCLATLTPRMALISLGSLMPCRA